MMFRGFSGYIQADAHAIYDALFRGDAVDETSDAPTEVACWSHVRRRFWEAAVSGFAVVGASSGTNPAGFVSMN